MSLILSIDTSISSATVVLHDSFEVLSIQKLLSDESISEKITQLIQKALSESEKALSDLSAIAINTGPGSYTSLRVGFSSAKGLCYVLKIPLIGLDTFEILYSASFDQKNNFDAIICMVDARRMDAYVRIYNSSGENTAETEFITFDQNFVHRFQNQKILCIGDGAVKLQGSEILPPTWQISKIIQHAEHMVSLSTNKYASECFLDVAYSVPYYFKQPNITTPKHTF